MPSSSQLRQSSRLGLGLILALSVHGLALQAMPRLSDKLPTSFNNAPPLRLSLQSPKPIAAPSIQPSPKQSQTTETVKPSLPPKPTPKPPKAAAAPSKPQPLSQSQSRPKPQPRRQPRRQPSPQPSPQLSASELMANSLALANSADDLWDLDKHPSKPNLRHKTITPSTQEPKYRSYLTAWVHKVETIGRRNYPTDKHQQLNGNMTLDVAIDADGRAQQIELISSSGNPLLDQAAINIVKLGSPYAPLPANILEHTDILHIRRQWVFASGTAQSP